MPSGMKATLTKDELEFALAQCVVLSVQDKEFDDFTLLGLHHALVEALWASKSRPDPMKPSTVDVQLDWDQIDVLRTIDKLYQDNPAEEKTKTSKTHKVTGKTSGKKGKR